MNFDHQAIHRIFRVRWIVVVLAATRVLAASSYGDEPADTGPAVTPALAVIDDTNAPDKDANVPASPDPPMVGQWKVPSFGGDGRVKIEPVDGESATFELAIGDPLTGIYWDGPHPTENFRWTFSAKRTDGYDFFAAATFPVGDGFVTFVPGGWGGTVAGLSSIDGFDASENETTQYLPFETDQWYKFRIEVDTKSIRVWRDDQPVLTVDRGDKKFSLRNEMDLCKPFGLAAFQSDALIRDIRLAKIKPIDESRDPVPANAVETQR